MNYHLFQWINGDAGRFDGLDDVLEFAAVWLIYPAFAIAAALTVQALVRRRMRAVVQFAATLALAFGAATVLAHLSTEVRPFQSHPVHQLIAHDNGIAMPSDHATAAFALAFGVGFFLHRRWGLALGGIAVVIGFARVWVGVHYPGDIVAAAVLAGLAALEVAAFSRWRDVQRDSEAGGRMAGVPR